MKITRGMQRELEEYHRAVVTTWSFLKTRIMDFQNTDSWWDRAFKDAKALTDGFKGSTAEEFTRGAVKEALLELQRKAKT